MIDPITLQTAVRKNVTDALAEDIGTGDLSASLIPASEKTQANVITRDNGVFCGQLWVAETMDQIDNTVVIHWKVQDADPVKAGDLLFTLSGASAPLLTAERTMLNFAQFLSGVATKTAQYSALIKDTKTVLLDTRKTVPGLRIAQKYAVACGGGQNHRLGLFDAYLLKENHICAAGSIALAVSAARRNHPDRAVEVETENLDELQQAIEAGADIAMIDNFSLTDTAKAVELAKERIKLEASGGINTTTIREIAAYGVDYISVGEITKNVDPLDLSMRFVT